MYENAPETKIALTLYNLRDYCRTEQDLDSTLGRVSKIGYEAVQISGVGPIKPEAVKSLLDKHGLYCCATHEGLKAYEDDFDSVVRKMKLWNCDFTALGHPGNDFWSREGVADFAARLEAIGRKFHDEGIMFGFHNHHKEFTKYTDKTFLDELYENTSDKVLAELDLHWVQRGGADPAAWIRKMAGRTSVLHFKDFSIRLDEENAAIPEFAEIGEGNMNWPEILKACRETDVRWYVIEQDTPWRDRDIFDSMKISYDNLKSMGVD